MTLTQFTELIKNHPDPVVLLEGRREIPRKYAAKAKETGKRLARIFPGLRFRSGNASGSDESFSSGVAEIDAQRLQIIAPYKTHKEKSRYEKALYDSPESLSASAKKKIVSKTVEATPKYKSLVEDAKEGTRLAAKGAYLVRDTMKAAGHSKSFPKPVAALFYVNLQDPEAGGTGHTIRACKKEGVPCVFQDSWGSWTGV